MGYFISGADIAAFAAQLRREERAKGTLEKYLRDVRALQRWLDGRPVAQDSLAGWKAWLLQEGYAPATVNSMLAAVNTFLRCMGWTECRVKFLKIQRRLFREHRRELTRAEYARLLDAARQQGRERLALLMETICATGIRVSELRYITLAAVRLGRAEIALKGKLRTILLPAKLCRKLQAYARKHAIASGELFLTARGKPLGRRQIWGEMKGLCPQAGVEKSKVFPHNLRHLFATTFYQSCKDIARLADVLGHSSIETTRVYLLTTGREHRRALDRLGLVS